MWLLWICGILVRNACFIGWGGVWQMKISLFDGFFEFDFDWKAVVGTGIIILGCALLSMWGGNGYC